MKKILLSLVVLFASTIFVSAQTVDEIVTKHIAALGGEEKLRSVKSLVMDISLSVMGMDLENKTSLVVNTAMLNTTKVMDDEMIQAFDGETAWWKRPTMMGGTGEPEIMPAEMAKGAISQTVAFSFLDYKTDGSKLELIGTEKVKGADAYHLKSTSKTGYVFEAWIDLNSNFITKYMVELAGEKQEIFYSNYKTIDGIIFSHTMTTTNPQAGEMVFETKKITINPTLDLAMFKYNKK
jgi:hypothetical protein